MNSDLINLQFTTIKDPLPGFIYEGLGEYSKNANSYKPQPKELVDRLAKKFNLPTEMVYLTAGADEAIQMLAHAYGKKALVFTPTYVVYSDIEEFGGELERLFSIVGDEYKIDTSKKDVGLIYLANPNNPCGFTSKEKVLELIKNNPQTKVVVDEVYSEFAPELSVVAEVRENPNLAILRSFSKSFGMAGNRIGFIVANPEIIAVVRNKAQWSNVSYLSVGAAMVALDHEDYFKKVVSGIIRRREKFLVFLRKKGFVVFPSKINAILIKFPTENHGQKFVDYLSKANIVVSHGNGASNIGLDKSYVRISIGNEEQMNRVYDIIRSYEA